MLNSWFSPYSMNIFIGMQAPFIFCAYLDRIVSMKPMENGAIFMENLARLFSLLADERGVSQSQLGLQAGISQSQIPRMFSRDTAFSVARARAIAEVLDVDIVLVVAGAEWMTTKKIPQCLTPLEVAESRAGLTWQLSKAGTSSQRERHKRRIPDPWGGPAVSFLATPLGLKP